jgi:hypothetical protein
VYLCICVFVFILCFSETLMTQDYSFSLFGDECLSEGLLSYLFHTIYFSWNFVWLYDLYISFKHPMHTTDKYMWCYSIAVYFFSILFTSIVFGFGYSPELDFVFGKVSFYIFVFFRARRLLVLSLKNFTRI